MFLLLTLDQLVFTLDLHSEACVGGLDGSSLLEGNGGVLIFVSHQASLLKLFAHFDGRFFLSGSI